jgi:hypothetical protein
VIYSTAATAGTANTGGGGGAGSGFASRAGQAGGSGIVVIRYPNVYKAATTTGNPTVSNSNGYITYTFTGTGTIQWV